MPFVVGHVQPDTPRTDLPLERFLPPWHDGMASRWLNNYAAPGSWVLDPFGQSPFSVLEIARAGYRVLVTANNPVSAFIIKVLATAPTLDEMQAALTLLGKSKSLSGQSLIEHIQSQYLLPCPVPDCASHADNSRSKSFEVERYIWHENQKQPSQATGKCKVCGHTTELELTDEHHKSLPPLPPVAMSRALALEKIAPPTDPLRAVMEDVVSYYTDRSLNLLLSILTQISSQEFSSRQKMLMQALFLSAADRGNQLWAYPMGRNRPRQLLCPPVYQEFNLWHSLENACHLWASQEKAITLRYYPEKLPQSGGICLFEGRLRELDPKPDPRQIETIYANLPRRNQAWWNLSGLWSGWLWGKEGVKTLRNSLLKQRYDWTWHATALEKVLARLKYLVRPAAPILLQVSELDPLFLLASVKAAQSAGFSLRTAACSGGVNILQTVWKFSPSQLTQYSINKFRDAAREIATDFLSNWGEPSGYMRLFTQMILGLQTRGLLFNQDATQANAPINKTQEDLDPVFTDPSLFHRFSPGVSTDTGTYWLASPPEYFSTLADNVEGIIRQEFLHSPQLSALEIAKAINHKHPGMMTPDHELVQTILRSYATRNEQDGQACWVLNENEQFTTRAQDIKSLREIIEKIARKLAIKRQISDEAIYFLDEHDHEIYTFFVSASAMISETIQRHRGLSGKKLIVLPGSRANLVSYKLRRDPNLQAMMQDDWHFVKFRLLRNIYENPLLTRELFAYQILGDPPEYRVSQLALF